MSRMRRWMLVGLALILFASVSLAQTKPSHPRHHRKPAPKPLVLPPLPAGPLPQLPMDLMPAAPPKVGFEGGLLTIVAQNSTLGDILRDVQKLTGASIEMPTKVTERVVTRLGPGAPRDVLASLLNGSSFNYVMVGSLSDPSAVTSVVLSPKTAGSAPQTTANSYPGAAPQPYVVQQVSPQPPAPGAVDNSNDEDQDASADDNSDQDQPDTNGTTQPDQSQTSPPNVGPKTPEQILEMLRRQQQQPPIAVPNPQRPPEN